MVNGEKVANDDEGRKVNQYYTECLPGPCVLMEDGCTYVIHILFNFP